MNNITFVMGVVLTLLILFLSAHAQTAEAAEMDDVTLQVLETNDPAEIINEIELPELESTAAAAQARDREHGKGHDVDGELHDIERELKHDIDDSREDIEDSIEESEEEVEDTHHD